MTFSLRPFLFPTESFTSHYNPDVNFHRVIDQVNLCIVLGSTDYRATLIIGSFFLQMPDGAIQLKVGERLKERLNLSSSYSKREAPVVSPLLIGEPENWQSSSGYSIILYRLKPVTLNIITAETRYSLNVEKGSTLIQHPDGNIRFEPEAQTETFLGAFTLITEEEPAVT